MRPQMGEQMAGETQVTFTSPIPRSSQPSLKSDRVLRRCWNA